MADETPPDTTPHRPPVRMGLRVVARHSAGRHGGRALAHEIVESHRPKHLQASTRLKRVAARSPAPPPPPAPPAAEFAYDAPPAGGGPAAPAPASNVPSPRELPRGMSDFAAQWLFGDQNDAQSSLMSMAEAKRLPEPTKEERVARFIARGGLERSRGARIVEGAASGTPLSADELGVSDAPEAPSSAPKKLSRAPAPSVSTPAPSAAAQEPEAPSEAPRRRLSRAPASEAAPAAPPSEAAPASPPSPASVARTPAATPSEGAPPATPSEAASAARTPATPSEAAPASPSPASVARTPATPSDAAPATPPAAPPERPRPSNPAARPRPRLGRPHACRAARSSGRDTAGNARCRLGGTDS